MGIERGMGVAKRRHMQCTFVPLRCPLVMVSLSDCTAGKCGSYIMSLRQKDCFFSMSYRCFAAAILLTF